MQTYEHSADDARLDALRDQHIRTQLSIAKIKTKTDERKIKKLLRQIDEINQQKLGIVERCANAKI